MPCLEPKICYSVFPRFPFCILPRFCGYISISLLQPACRLNVSACKGVSIVCNVLPFLASFSAISLPSSPKWEGTHWTMTIFLRALRCLRACGPLLCHLSSLILAVGRNCLNSCCRARQIAPNSPSKFDLFIPTVAYCKKSWQCTPAPAVFALSA